jgi:hypothetical protein
MLLLKTFEFPVASTPRVKIGFSNRLLQLQGPAMTLTTAIASRLAIRQTPPWR